MATKSLSEQFQFTGKTPILPTLDRLMLALESRFKAMEAIQPELDTALDELKATALSRMDEVFTPLILDAQERLAEFGANFAATAEGTYTISTGSKTFYVVPDEREGYVYADYVVLRPVGAENNSLIAQVNSYNRATGALDVTVEVANGSGSYDDWSVRLGAAPDLAHVADYNNPHQTTAAQVGAYTTAQIDAQATDTVNWASNTFAVKSLNLGDINPTAARANLNVYSKQEVDAAVASGIPIGTKMVFIQPSAPIGWTKITENNDCALRIVSGTTGGNAGGVWGFSGVMGVANWATSQHTADSFSTAQHRHYMLALNYAENYVESTSGYNMNEGGGIVQWSNYYGQSGYHLHSVTTDLRCKYVDAIYASKN